MLFRHPVSGSEVPPSTCLYIDHFNSCLQHCSNIEKTLQQFYGNFLFFWNLKFEKKALRILIIKSCNPIILPQSFKNLVKIDKLKMLKFFANWLEPFYVDLHGVMWK